jgi:hypothetical protein
MQAKMETGGRERFYSSNEVAGRLKDTNCWHFFIQRKGRIDIVENPAIQQGNPVIRTASTRLFFYTFL